MTSVLVVAGSQVAAARIEAMLRGRSELRVAVSRPAELARRLDECALAVVVLAPAPDGMARALETLRGLPEPAAVVLLVSDPASVWTPQTRRSGVRAVLRDDATVEAPGLRERRE